MTMTPLPGRHTPYSLALLGSGAASLTLAMLNFLTGNTIGALAMSGLGVLSVALWARASRMCVAKVLPAQHAGSPVTKRANTHADVSHITRSQIAYCLGLGVVCLIGGIAGMLALLRGNGDFVVAAGSIAALILGTMCLYGVTAVWIASRRED